MEQKTISLNDRMKGYEKDVRVTIPSNSHVIIRLDGRSFSKFCKRFEKPFDDNFINMMNNTLKHLCYNIQGAKFGFVQSDEISIYFTDTDNEESQLWFGGRVDKILSIASALATGFFVKECIRLGVQIETNIPQFDCRYVILPSIEEVKNNFLWRQSDCKRNAISMVAQHFITKNLFKVSTSEMLEKLNEIDIDFEEQYEDIKQGRVCYKEPKLVVRFGIEEYRKKWSVKPAFSFKEEYYKKFDTCLI